MCEVDHESVYSYFTAKSGNGSLFGVIPTNMAHSVISQDGTTHDER